MDGHSGLVPVGSHLHSGHHLGLTGHHMGPHDLLGDSKSSCMLSGTSVHQLGSSEQLPHSHHQEQHLTQHTVSSLVHTATVRHGLHAHHGHPLGAPPAAPTAPTAGQLKGEADDAKTDSESGRSESPAGSTGHRDSVSLIPGQEIDEDDDDLESQQFSGELQLL